MKRLAAFGAIFLVAGCASPPPAAAPSFACNAAAAQAAVGKLATGGLMEDARQAANARMVRTLRPGQAVTLEFNAERLNLEVDAANVVVRVSCG
jgi:uncharacterized lipoprotein YajG